MEMTKRRNGRIMETGTNQIKKFLGGKGQGSDHSFSIRPANRLPTKLGSLSSA
jgi:hypothetical protein